MSDFKKYRRTNVAEMRPYIPGEEKERGWYDKISVSLPDEQNGSPKEGDMIARNPENHDDKWLVAKEYFGNNFEKISDNPRKNLRNFLYKKPSSNSDEIFIETYDGYPVAHVDLCDSEWAEKLVDAYNYTYGVGNQPKLNED